MTIYPQRFKPKERDKPRMDTNEREKETSIRVHSRLIRLRLVTAPRRVIAVATCSEPPSAQEINTVSNRTKGRNET